MISGHYNITFTFRGSSREECINDAMESLREAAQSLRRDDLWRHLRDAEESIREAYYAEEHPRPRLVLSDRNRLGWRGGKP